MPCRDFHRKQILPRESRKKKHQIQNMKACRKEKRNKIQVQDILIIVAMLRSSAYRNRHPCRRHSIKRLHERTQPERNNRYYGCPAEENAGGKAFLVRDGYFDDCDLASAGTRNRDDAHATEAQRQTSESSSHSTEPQHTPPCARNWAAPHWMQ